jgi:hypothetical protein
LQAVATILLKNTPKEQLKNFASIELAFRDHVPCDRSDCNNLASDRMKFLKNFCCKVASAQIQFLKKLDRSDRSDLHPKHKHLPVLNRSPKPTKTLKPLTCMCLGFFNDFNKYKYLENILDITRTCECEAKKLDCHRSHLGDIATTPTVRPCKLCQPLKQCEPCLRCDLNPLSRASHPIIPKPHTQP